MQENKLTDKIYFPLIDLLRFFASVSVMCFHYFSTFLKTDTLGSIWLKYGYLGVELFFTISGFVIFFSLQVNIKDYFLGRFLRLYPIFWIMCTFTYITTLIFDKFNNTKEALSFPKYLFNLLIINNGKTVNMVDGSYWTLTIEIMFYIYIGIFVYLFKSKRLEVFYFSWLFISFIIFTYNFQELFISKLLLVRYSPYFVFGGALGLLYKNKDNLELIIKDRFFKTRIYLLLFFSFLMPHFINYKLHLYPTPSNNFGNFDFYGSIIILIIFPLTLLAVYFSRYIKEKKCLRTFMLLGSITYPLYLLHEKSGSLFINLFTDGIGYGRISVVSVLIAIFMIFISAVIANYEKKLRKILKGIISKYIN